MKAIYPPKEDLTPKVLTSVKWFELENIKCSLFAFIEKKVPLMVYYFIIGSS